MNHENQPPPNELEARIVALVLGEASPFEVIELERTIAEHPDRLRLEGFRRGLERVHGILTETGAEDRKTWKLPRRKRNKLLATLRTPPRTSDTPVEQELETSETVSAQASSSVKATASTASIDATAATAEPTTSKEARSPLRLFRRSRVLLTAASIAAVLLFGLLILPVLRSAKHSGGLDGISDSRAVRAEPRPEMMQASEWGLEKQSELTKQSENLYSYQVEDQFSAGSADGFGPVDDSKSMGTPQFGNDLVWYDTGQTVTERVKGKDAAANRASAASRYQWFDEQVQVADAAEELVVTPAKYESRESRVMVNPPSQRVEGIAPRFESVIEQTFARDASTPIATDENKTVQKRAMVVPPSTASNRTPARWDTVRATKEAVPALRMPSVPTFGDMPANGTLFRNGRGSNQVTDGKKLSGERPSSTRASASISTATAAPAAAAAAATPATPAAPAFSPAPTPTTPSVSTRATVAKPKSKPPAAFGRPAKTPAPATLSPSPDHYASDLTELESMTGSGRTRDLKDLAKITSGSERADGERAATEGESRGRIAGVSGLSTMDEEDGEEGFKGKADDGQTQLGSTTLERRWGFEDTSGATAVVVPGFDMPAAPALPAGPAITASAAPPAEPAPPSPSFEAPAGTVGATGGFDQPSGDKSNLGFAEGTISGGGVSNQGAGGMGFGGTRFGSGRSNFSENESDVRKESSDELSRGFADGRVADPEATIEELQQEVDQGNISKAEERYRRQQQGQQQGGGQQAAARSAQQKAQQGRGPDEIMDLAPFASASGPRPGNRPAKGLKADFGLVDTEDSTMRGEAGLGVELNESLDGLLGDLGRDLTQKEQIQRDRMREQAPNRYYADSAEHDKFALERQKSGDATREYAESSDPFGGGAKAASESKSINGTFGNDYNMMSGGGLVQGVPDMTKPTGPSSAGFAAPGGGGASNASGDDFFGGFHSFDMEVTNTGDASLSDITMTDNAGTPADAGFSQRFGSYDGFSGGGSDGFSGGGDPFGKSDSFGGDSFSGDPFGGGGGDPFGGGGRGDSFGGGGDPFGEPAAFGRDISRFLSRLGVPMPAGTSAVYQPRLGQIVVVNAKENHEVTQKILQQIGGGAAEVFEEEKEEDAKATAVLDKMDEIMIPEINFKDASIYDVANYLVNSSREHDRMLDPDNVGYGVDMIVDLPEFAAAPAPAAPDDFFGGPVGDAGFFDPDDGFGSGAGVPSVSISLKQVSLRDSLDFVSDITGLKYVVKNGVVVLRPKDSVDEVVTRFYPFTPGKKFTPTRPPAPETENPEQQKLRERMERIMIPELNFREAGIHDVLDFLVRTSRERDTEKDTAGVGIGVDMELAPNTRQPKVTIALRRVSLIDALELICTVNNLDYELVDGRVVLIPGGSRTTTKTHQVDRAMFGNIPTGKDGQADVTGVFERLGFPIEERAAVLYRPSSGELTFVHNQSGQWRMANQLEGLLLERHAKPGELKSVVYKLPAALLEKIHPLEDPDAGLYQAQGSELNVADSLRRHGLKLPIGSRAVYDRDREELVVESNLNDLLRLDQLVVKQEAAAEQRRKQHEAFPEMRAAEEAWSTFSLNVSDVSFKLAQQSLGKSEWPDPAKIRAEEFVNAMHYGDPSPTRAEKISCRVGHAAHPFRQSRDLFRIGLRTAAMGRGETQGLNLTLMLDVSGSMEREDRARSLRAAARVLASHLKAGDKVSLIGFARTPRLIADALPGQRAAELVALVDQTPSEGGTNLEAALALASEKAKQHFDAGSINRIVLLTDGAANLGDARPEVLSAQIESLREQGIAFDACGVGADDLNDKLLEALARKGDGRYYVLNHPADADAGFARQLAGALRPSAKNVKVQVWFNPERVDRYRLIGYEKHRLKKEDFRNDAVDAAEMAADESGVAVYEVEVLPEGKGPVGKVSVRFRDVASDSMVELSWPLIHCTPEPFEHAPASLQLAGTAAFFAERLKGGPAGAAVELPVLAASKSRIFSAFPNQTRVRELFQMIDQAQALER